MSKLLNIFQSPFFLAFVVALIIIPFLPDIFYKYKTELIDKKKAYIYVEEHKNRLIIYYNDLDNDGKSEKIECGYGNRNLDSFTIIKGENRLIRQINYGTLDQRSGVTFGDYDNNGLNEIYCFGKKGDSIYVYSTEPFSENPLRKLIHRKYVDSKWKSKHNDGRVRRGILTDLNGDGYKEFVFNINAAFSLQPRNFYAYDIRNDTILKSPESGAFPANGSHMSIFYDIDDDGRMEVITGTSATGNFTFEFPYTDTSAWLMVLDDNMQFLFEPVEFPSFTSGVTAMPYKTKTGTYIAVLYAYSGKLDKQSALYLFNSKGEKVIEKVFHDAIKSSTQSIITLGTKERSRLYIYNLKGEVAQLNEALDTIREYQIKEIALKLTSLDIDNDGEEELIFVSKDGQSLIITRNDFSHPIEVAIPNDGGTPYFEIKLNGGNRPNLSAQIGQQWYLLNYLPNPLYYLKYLFYAGIYLGLFLFIFGIQKISTYKLEQDKKQLEQTVKERTAEIQEQKEIIEKRNKDITDSIRYAERIQNTVLLPDKQIKDLLPNSFILFKPKDIVSGDFYWLTESQGKIFFIAADCTGHGVPGAFMSMICTTLLNESINNKGITQPNKILYEVRKEIIKSLKQTGEQGEQRDGMDAVLCSWDKKKTLEFAAAYNPFFLIRNGELLETKPDKQPVGFHTGEQSPFTHHELQVETGDMIYLFSDGYQDQFGGPRGKKFMIKRQKELLLAIHQKDVEEQKQILDKTIEEWKGDIEQIDDILVIGVRF